jgi:serine/threonine protein kinase
LSVAFDVERLARFQREAEVVAALNHPNIAAIYGLEKAAGMTALVMERVEGPTLADRIAQGPMPIDDAPDREADRHRHRGGSRTEHPSSRS